MKGDNNDRRKRRKNIFLIWISILLFYLAFFIIALGVGLIIPEILIQILIIGLGLGFLQMRLLLQFLPLILRKIRHKFKLCVLFF